MGRGGSRKVAGGKGRGASRAPKVSVASPSEVAADKALKRKPLTPGKVSSYVSDNLRANAPGSGAPASLAAQGVVAIKSLSLEGGTPCASKFDNKSVERIIQRKLLHVYGKLVIDCAKTTSGESVRQWISGKLDEKHGKGGNLTSNDWIQFDTDFKLGNTGIKDSLPGVVGNDGITTLLLEKLAAAHDKNPVTRSTEPLLRYLEFVEVDLNYAEIHGVTLASLKSPIITHQAQSAMLNALLTYLVRITDQLWNLFNHCFYVEPLEKELLAKIE